MMLIVLPIELKPGPDADDLFAEVKDAILGAADTYSRKDPMGENLEVIADSARFIDLEAMRLRADERFLDEWTLGRQEGYNAALKDIAGGGK